MSDNIVDRVSLYPHCGNETPQKLIYKHELYVDIYNSRGNLERDVWVGTYYVAICKTCNEILLYYWSDPHMHVNDYNRAYLVWPDSGDLPESIPTKIRNCYKKAYRIKNISPNAFAGQKIRKALELICNDKDIKSGKLADRLKELNLKEKLPSFLFEISDILRLLGNVGVHAGEQKVTDYQVILINDFFKVII
ncbi:DUF4145 domain-containing protein [bacterium]|nr:DUF4145 domain-containing protein [bacterium]MBU4511530.1 DUF4145 domain-containing protein [bacterium]